MKLLYIVSNDFCGSVMFVCFYRKISQKTDTAKIIKLDTQLMFHD